MKSLLARLRLDIRGNALILAAAGLTAIVGGAGLAVDTVQWYLWKRQLQQAVDTGASAGALSLARGGGYNSSASRELNRNADSTLSVTIERIASPPVIGAYAGDTGAVEVVATTSRSLPFSSIFVASAPAVRARAVAKIQSEGEFCVISLAGNGVGVNAAGNAQVELGCGVAANSNGSASIDLDGSSWVDAPYFHSAGGIQASSSNYPAGAQLHPYGLPVLDPLASRNLQVPTSPAACTANNYSVKPNQSVVLAPGRYCNGLDLKGDVVMLPGVYIIDRGSLKINSQATIVGEGVTIVLTGTSPSNVATLDIQGGAELDLRAPTSLENAYWRDILFFQDPAAASNVSKMAGGSDLFFQGIVYMPEGDLDFTGNSGQHSECLLLIVDRVDFKGDASLDNDCPVSFGTTNVTARYVRVVE